MFWSLKYSCHDYKINKHTTKGKIKIAIICRKTKKRVHCVDESRFKIINGDYHITK